MANWCKARLLVTGRASDVRRFARVASVPVGGRRIKPLSERADERASRVFRGDMLAGECRWIFSERATPLRPGLLEKKYVFQACDEHGQEHFRNTSRLYPDLRFVYVYGWDGWNEYSYGSYLIWRGHVRGYRVPVRLIEKALVKHGVDDNPNDEWPYEPEMEAETELMDLAEKHWRKSVLRR